MISVMRSGQPSEPTVNVASVMALQLPPVKVRARTVTVLCSVTGPE